MTSGFELITTFLNEELERDMGDKKKVAESLLLNKDTIGTDLYYKHEIVWENVILFLILHTCGAYGIFLLFTGTYSISTLLWGKCLCSPIIITFRQSMDGHTLKRPLI